jgi:hypothetical protein
MILRFFYEGMVPFLMLVIPALALFLLFTFLVLVPAFSGVS